MKMTSEIKAQVNKVLEVYSDTNCAAGLSAEYEKEFDILAAMKMEQQAIDYRLVWGLSSEAKTPYCS